MAEFFTAQMDYVFFVYGLAFVLLAAVCLSLGRQARQTLPWHWLAAFGLLHGLNEWLDLAAIGMADGETFRWVRAAVLGLSFVALVEFGRLGLVRLGVSRMPGRWLAVVLASLVCGTLGLGPNTFAAAVRYGLGFTGGVLAAAALWKASHRPAVRGGWA